MQRFNIRAVVVGSLSMLALDLLTGIVSFTFFTGDALSSEATQSEISAAATAIEQNSEYLLASLLLGTFSTVLGGYIAARLARKLPLFNACAVGVVGIAAAVLLGGSSDSPGWFSAFGYLSTIPAAIIGGWLERRESNQGS